MARPTSLAPTHAIRERRRRRSERLTANKAVADALVSAAGLVGAPVRNQAGAEVGRLVDVVVRWQGEPYPLVTGLVVRVGRRQLWVSADQIEHLGQREIRLRSARLDLRDVERRPGEVRLNTDVIDHQMVDVDGVRVFRAADLYLARVGAGTRLVGADVGFGTLLRRLGPARSRRRPTPEKVIDWAAVQPFSDDLEGPVHLTRPNQELTRLRPGELADLLEDLGRRQREELLAVLGEEKAADALEEMESDELSNLLRELPPETTAKVLAEMEPDEAAEALRELDPERRHELLDALPSEIADELSPLVAYGERTAGGVMTTNLVVAPAADTVAAIRRQLVGERAEGHALDLDGVLVVDGDGVLIDDVRLIELFVAEPDQTLGELTHPEDVVTVTPDSSIDDAVDALVEARTWSVVVVDDLGRPVGRILADDLVDALVPDRGRFRFRRILS
ncbi:MAG: CBS domain-containing protein [Acidimicrobiales bacterium]